MIIFGTKGITTTPDKGEFHCVSCNESQEYKLRRVRRFFTLYFIPLIPLNKLGEYVECQNCKDTFTTEILSDQAEMAMFNALYFTAIIQVMIHMLLADGVIDDDEVKEMREIFKNLTDVELTDEEAREQIAEVQKSGDKLDPYIETLRGELNENGKEMVIRAALMIAFADGEFQVEEQELILHIGGLLEMSKAHIKGIISEMLDERQAS